MGWISKQILIYQDDLDKHRIKLSRGVDGRNLDHIHFESYKYLLDGVRRSHALQSTLIML